MDKDKQEKERRSESGVPVTSARSAGSFKIWNRSFLATLKGDVERSHSGKRRCQRLLTAVPMHFKEEIWSKERLNPQYGLPRL